MWFLSSLGTLNDAITITSIVLSVLSVLIAVLSMLTERNIAQTQGYATIAMKITGHAVTSGSNPMKCKTLKRVLAEPRVHCSAVEVLKPTPINQGFEWNVNFYFGDDNKKTIDYHQIFPRGYFCMPMQRMSYLNSLNGVGDYQENQTFRISSFSQ
eukprot:221942_1